MSEETIKKYVLQINKKGEILKTIDLQMLDPDERRKLLEAVFAGGMRRIGYKKKSI